MGRLRKEPKRKPFLSEDEYREYYGVLTDAKNAATDNHVYFDLEESENANKVRKAFLHVAEKEAIPVVIRRERGSQSLSFAFKESGKTTPSRMSAQECQNRILNALSSSEQPLQKSEIINSTGISPSTWNIRIKELMDNGKVMRKGDRRDTKYSLSDRV